MSFDLSQVAQRLKLKPCEFMTFAELDTVPSGTVFVFDVECYRNFFYVAFKCLHNGKFIAFEQSPASVLNVDQMLSLMWRFCIVGFNSLKYDLPLIMLAAKGATCSELKDASDFIIQDQSSVYIFCKKYKVEIPNINHIDLIEVAPLLGSLKLYSGRLHCETMQDLPIDPSHLLSQSDAEIIRPYCCNDLQNTELLFNDLAPQLKLRLKMSEKYGIDLRSKSDAQVAEAVICKRLAAVLGAYPKKPNLKDGLMLRYSVPDFVSFQSKTLNDILQIVRDAVFELDANGSPVMPKSLEKLEVKIGKSSYKLGIGGLHSNEKQIAHIADENTYLRDNDVASYYPRIILNQRLFPAHLGEAFLEVYEGIVNDRLEAKAKTKAAKKAHDKVATELWATETDGLKITINGSFGKLGNKYSALYSPQLMLQVTITGQLCLLMLIEKLENTGISVVSGNTDGIVSKYPKERHEDVRKAISEWESVTDFETEETAYSAVYSRDVNNYIAIKAEGGEPEAERLDDRLGAKTKGTYSERGLWKNPEHNICTDAVLQYLVNKIPVAETVRACTDIRRFVSVRNVKGGGEKDGVYLGKVVRWYYAKGQNTPITYVGSGNKVPKSDGAKPLMDLPTIFPDDIDYEWYIEKAKEILVDCGSVKPRNHQTSFFD